MLAMCVVSIAWHAHPDWVLVVAGNRDEFHARPTAPLARWRERAGVIAGRDMLSGGSWMGVSEAGRFAVVTNVRSETGPQPDRASRGALVADFLAGSGGCADPEMIAFEAFNPFCLLVANGDEARLISNHPESLVQPVQPGITGLSNGEPGANWPRLARLNAAVAGLIKDNSHGTDQLFALLADETPDAEDADARPVFIRDGIYGTRCSTLVLVDRAGGGRIIERRFGANGEAGGETSFDFTWRPS